MQQGFNPNMGYGQVPVPQYQMAPYQMMGQPRMLMNPQNMRFQAQPGMPRAQAPFQRAPMGVRNMYAQPQNIGVRPMMAPAGVRQQFGVNSPYKFNQQVRNAPQQQQFGQDFQPQVNQLTNQFQAANISNNP